MKTKHIIFFFLFVINCQIVCIAQEIQGQANVGKPVYKFSGLYYSDGSSPQPSLLSKNQSALPEGFPFQSEKYVEQVEKRTLKTKSFVTDDGEIVVYSSSKNINYQSDDGTLNSINPKLFESVSGWSAVKQEFPAFLNTDLTTAISINATNKITFNRNSIINNEKILIDDYTIGEDGAYLKNAISGIDKKIIFLENAVKSEYIINEPLNRGSDDLVISEEIEIPQGYFFKKVQNQRKIETYDYVVYTSDGTEKARFHTPFFFDSNINNASDGSSFLFGSYNLKQLDGRNILEFMVPSFWLNSSSRGYPITIDPLVTGPVSNYPAVNMNSCVLPNYASDSMLITIPSGITITGFFVEDSYSAEIFSTPTSNLNNGHMSISTICGTLSFSCNDTNSALPGTCYLVPNTNLKTQLACCFTPSCSPTTFYLKHALARDSTLGTGCNQDFIYYNSISLLPPWPNTTFSAYVTGRTIETVQSEWSVSASAACSDSCTTYLNVTSNFGVLAYKVRHPWTNDSIVFGNSTNSCNSTGSASLLLHIPGCPPSSNSITIPPPIISDSCGNIVAGLISKTVTCTGINENFNSASININPNPFTSQTTITFSQEQKNTSIKILDALGQEIKSISVTGKKLVLEKGVLHPGIYFLQLKTEQGIVSKKIVINQ